MTLDSFLHRTFAPCIGSVTSPAVDLICKKNNLTFVQLVQPFSNISLNYTLKDPSGNDLAIKNVRVSVVDAKNGLSAPRDASLSLNEAVADSWCDVTKLVQTTIAPLDIPVECPWFDAWSDAFIRVLPPSEHEFTKHMLGCMLITGANDSLETIQTMLESLRTMRTEQLFYPGFFKFFVVVFDSQIHDKSKSVAFFDSVKSAYGLDHCFLLEMNNRVAGEESVSDFWAAVKPLPLPEPVVDSDQNDVIPDVNHPLSSNQPSNVDGVKNTVISFGEQLSKKDVDNLKELLQFVVRNALLPFVETQIYILNDLVANKKGVSRSLLSATKRFFGTRPPAPGTAVSSFPPDAPELQLRRLGDLYFLFGSYANAFQSYYAAKRELGLELSWLCYAGALEMTALAASMLPDTPKKAVEYAEEAINQYATLRQQAFTVRATLFTVYSLKQRELNAEGARLMMRMSSEDNHLRSALYLEQAAYFLLNDKKARKYAMYMVLAANRFTKSRQMRHALRCIRQALQIYDGRGWSLAEDHIYWSIGRIAGQLYKQRNSDVELLPEGLRALSQLLISCSRQEASHQANYLLEFLNMHQAWQQASQNEQQRLVKLPLPIVEENSASVRIALMNSRPHERHIGDSPEDAIRWARMEELALGETPSGVPMIFRPSLPVLTKHLPNPQGLVVAVSEVVEVQLALKNPLHISLPLTQIALLWTWSDPNGQTFADNSVAESGLLPSLLIPPDATQIITLTVVARREGVLQITGFSYSLTTATADDSLANPPVVRGSQELIVRGPKLKPPKDRPNAECFADDKRLHITILPAAPLLTATETSFRLNVLTGEIQSVPLDLTNSGNLGLKSLCAVTDAGSMLNLPQNLVAASKLVNDADKSNYQVVTVKLDNTLEPNKKLPMKLWIRAPDTPGIKEIRVLLVYQGIKETKHRVLRIVLRLNVVSGLQISASLTTRPDETGLTAISCISAANHHGDALKLSRLVLASSQHKLQPSPCYPLQEDMTVKHSEKCYLVNRVSCGNPKNTSQVSVINLDGSEDTLCTTANQLLLSLASMKQIILGLLWQTSVEGGVKNGLSLVTVDVKPLKIDVVPRRPQISGQSDVVFYLSHSDRVLHSFAKSRLCLVNVNVAVINSSQREAKVYLNAVGQEGAATVEDLLYTPNAGTAFTWVGRSRSTVLVPPLGTVDVSMRAAFAAPGTYDLAARFTARLDDLALAPPAASPLIVADADTR